MTDNEKAKELAWKRDRGYYTPEYAYKKGFDAGYEARTVPADVREAVDVVRPLMDSTWVITQRMRDSLCTLIAAVSGDGWISVDERLPERTGTVLIQLPLDDEMEVALFVGDRAEPRFFAHKRNVTSEVVAWRPLPKPYKRIEESYSC